jgi:hypothetical protein
VWVQVPSLAPPSRKEKVEKNRKKVLTNTTTSVIINYVVCASGGIGRLARFRF